MWYSTCISLTTALAAFTAFKYVPHQNASTYWGMCAVCVCDAACHSAAHVPPFQLRHSFFAAQQTIWLNQLHNGYVTTCSTANTARPTLVIVRVRPLQMTNLSSA